MTDQRHHQHSDDTSADVAKLRLLLPHWMDHNEEHAVGLDQWVERATALGHEDTAQIIERAAEEMRQANRSLQLALESLGGPGAEGPLVH